MPANEQTWRNIPLMHRVFAISGVAMFIATIAVFWADQAREWRGTQKNVVDLDTQMIQWRELQYKTDDATRSHEELEQEKLRADAAPVDPAKLAQFGKRVDDFNQDMERLKDSFRVRFNQQEIDAEQKNQAKSAAEANAAWMNAANLQNEAEKASAKYHEMRTAAKSDADANVVAALETAGTANRDAENAVVKATALSKAAADQRAALVNDLNNVVNRIRVKENLALGDRKFKSAEVDAAKANVDIAIRDGKTNDIPKLEDVVQARMGELNALNLNYQAKNAARVALQKIVGEITQDQVDAAKKLDAANADLATLQKTYATREEPYFIPGWLGPLPWLYPGKGLLNLPVLNAFNPPQKIENLWSAGLMQNYSHAMVRRFDRCTTCHQLMQRSLPGQPQDPAYIHERDLIVWLNPPEAIVEEAGDSDIKKLERTYGMRIAPHGLVSFDDVTVSLVLPKSAAALAQIESASSQPIESQELRENVAEFTSVKHEAANYKILPGLLVGDVIASVEDEIADRGADRVAARLLAAVGSGKPLQLTVRRGLGNPYTTHPRLDLFVGDNSPHPMGTFGCTVCHDGQGNATAFKWASHSPNDGPDDPDQSRRWAREHGWFDNHHWIYPMWPKRFEESGCVKCHHEVVELEASERFPDPPAPKLTHGYHLIRKYGCYGCHEVNGFDGPRKRVGPDLRTEPNFYAAALQLGHLLAPQVTDLEQTQKAAQAKFDDMHKAAEEASEEEQKSLSEQAAKLEADLNRLNQQVTAASRALELAPEVAARNYDNAARNELYQIFTADAAIKDPAQRAFTPEIHRTAAVLKDVEVPGSLRKPGPTLRYVRDKDDSVFLYDWVANPRNFRPSTRMPQFFGLTKHLKPEPKSLEASQRLEPVEIHSIVKYLEHNSQEFVPIKPPKGITEDSREDKVARGKTLFETRGCLACHEHADFPKAKEYRGKDEIVQGPDLSAIAQKFDTERNPKGREWLYSWIKDPQRYSVRTLMPNVFLEPIEDKLLGDNGEPMLDDGGKPKTRKTDPAADIVEYLLDRSHVAKAEENADADAGEDEPAKEARHEGDDQKPWEPVAAASAEVDSQALKELMLEYLRESFHESRLEEYYTHGLPERMRGELKVAEQDLIVPQGEELTDDQRLLYIGRKTIAKFGCYGCHDVPGFEDAKPIGTGLADWGRKDPSRLAFEHISHYLHEGHGSEQIQNVDRTGDIGLVPPFVGDEHGHGEEMPVYYERALESGNRIGFIYQKLREPRSYDFEKTENKKYNDRLRMPQFPFDTEEREAVITFVLGLVAEPPTEKYVYQPTERQKTIIAGKQVLETFNCGGCHILEGERWKLSAAPDIFGAASPPKTFPFALHGLDPAIVGKSATTDRRGMVEAELRGLPSLEAGGDYGALPVIRDPDGADFAEGEKTQPRLASYEFMLFNSPAAVGGETYQPGTKLTVPGANLSRKYPTEGGYLTRYLSPVVYELEKKANPNAKGDQVFGWLPPPLMGEGKKVQTAWLYDFLMEPYPIRPATFLRMPKFNLSRDDTSKLVAYFAAKDNASYPYEFDQRRQGEHLASKQAEYAKEADGPNAAPESPRDRLDAAMKTVTNRTYCVQCHSVADFQSDNSPRAQGPNLARVYQRLRPDYLRRWIAYPTLILPYTAMPENIKYNAEADQLSDKWYHGTRTDQVDGLVDLLMNFDEYAKRQTKIADLVPPPMKSDATTEAAAETGGE
jgi:cytochrome c2